MATDPRNGIDDGPIREGDSWYVVGGFRSWDELLEEARAILAADAEWRLSQLPTIEELRERYPRHTFTITPRVPCGPTFCDVASIDGSIGTHHGSEADALEWLVKQTEAHDETPGS